MKNPFENGLNLSRYASKTGITTKVLVLAPALILGGSTLGVLLDRAAPAYAQEKPVNPDCTMTLRVEERDQDYDFLDRLAYGSLSLSKKDVPCNEAPQEAADLSAEFYRIKAE
ncbi:hypothetical protein HY025_03550, partial [Candidatus Daviesbacteria bacterium]|nr:hypothetical protein [Candidatus Daviesbacteria bacterium]